MKHISLITLLSFFSFQLLYAQKYPVVKTPVWVKPVDIPQHSTFDKYDIKSGYYLTLGDYQVNLEEDANYTRQVINVVSYSGITNASQLLISYDTSYQQLKIHHLYIWRKGVKLDRTKDLSFERMNNEYNLQKGIYMGMISAYDNLDDIRKDDLIDFAYSIIGNNPIFDHEKYLFMPLEGTNPIDLYAIRILFAKDKDYRYRCVDCDSISFKDTIVGKERQLEIVNSNIKAIEFEENMPSWVIPYKYFTLSSLHSWKEVNTWAQRVFALKKEPDLNTVFKEIFTGTETMDAKINKIIDYVQDDIRYMGIESGIGSIKPSAPDQVVKQRFGDCKDKSLLLVSLLKKIGVTKAYPALVNVSMLHELDKLMESNEVFSHCIVMFEYENEKYWVDPTITQQGGNYKNIAIPDYGRALVIGFPSDTLPLMQPKNSTQHISYIEEMTVRSFTEPAALVIKSLRNGIEADQRRTLLEQYSTTDLSKMLTDDLKLMYPTVTKTSDLKITDDMAQNTVGATYTYDIDGFWQDGDENSDKSLAGYWFFKFEPQTVYQSLNMFTASERKHDFAMAYPLNIEYTMTFHFPKNMLVSDTYRKFDNEGFFFDERIEQLSSKSFKVIYHFTTKASSIKAKEYSKVEAEKKDINKGLPIVIYFKK